LGVPVPSVSTIQTPPGVMQWMPTSLPSASKSEQSSSGTGWGSTTFHFIGSQYITAYPPLPLPPAPVVVEPLVVEVVEPLVVEPEPPPPPAAALPPGLLSLHPSMTVPAARAAHSPNTR